MQLQTSFNNNHHDNFAFLKEGLKELYQQAILAERYYFTDPQSSLVKIRLFVEIACHELGKHFKLKPPVHGDLVNKIRMLQSAQVIDEWVICEMHSLRHDGNRSVHMTEVNGSYVAQLSISRSRMQKHMESLHELARYVAKTVLGEDFTEAFIWREPSSCELTTFVADALKGSKEASYYLANKFYAELLEMDEQKGDSRWWKKDQYLEKQADLLYWLEKAHKQGHAQSWFLFAKSYANNLLASVTGRDTKFCFKKALADDELGEVAFEFGTYLKKCDEVKLGDDYIRQAAEKGYHPALTHELSNAFKSNSDKQYWVDRAIDATLPEAFSIDTFLKLEAYEQDISEEALKSLRSSLVVAQARRAPGISFLKAYVDYTIHSKLDREEATKIMVDNHESLPEFLAIEGLLYKQISDNPEHFKLMVKIYHEAVKHTKTDLEAADLKFSMMKQALNQASSKTKVNSAVTTPRSIPDLLQEAVDAGHEEACEFASTPEGKAVLKSVGL